MLDGEAYRRLTASSDLRAFYQRIAARLELEAAPSPEMEAQYQSQWGRPQSLQQEIQEVERLMQDWRKRGGNLKLLEPVLGALRQQMADSEGRVAQVREPDDEYEFIRMAELDDVPEGFTPLGGGFYREGHTIWELRAAEDEEGGYLLARRTEERAVDLRPNFNPQASAKPRQLAARSLCGSCLKPGTEVTLIRQGQLMPVIVIEVHDSPEEAEPAATVQDEAGQQMQAPLDMIVTDMTVQMPQGLPQAPAAPAPMPAAPMPAALPAPAAPAVMAAPPMPMPMPAGPAMPSPGIPMEQMLGEGEAMLAMGLDTPKEEMAQAPNGCDCQTGCPCPCHQGKSVKKAPAQGMNPDIEPSSKDPDADPAQAANDGAQSDSSEDSTSEMTPSDDGSEESTEEAESPLEKEAAVGLAFLIRAGQIDEGQVVAPTKRFAPQYMGGRFTFDPNAGDVFSVEGSSRANPMSDRTYGVPNPVTPYPNAKAGERTLNDRVRLVPHGGGEPVFVSPIELQRNFEVVGQLGGGRDDTVNSFGETARTRPSMPPQSPVVREWGRGKTNLPNMPAYDEGPYQQKEWDDLRGREHRQQLNREYDEASRGEGAEREQKYPGMMDEPEISSETQERMYQRMKPRQPSVPAPTGTDRNESGTRNERDPSKPPPLPKRNPATPPPLPSKRQTEVSPLPTMAPRQRPSSSEVAQGLAPVRPNSTPIPGRVPKPRHGTPWMK